MAGLDQCPLLVERQEEEARGRGGWEAATTAISVFANILIVSIIVTVSQCDVRVIFGWNHIGGLSLTGSCVDCLCSSWP